jgi:hypothetical protein
MVIHPFLTNLEDEILLRGRICKAQNWYKKKNKEKNSKFRYLKITPELGILKTEF